MIAAMSYHSESFGPEQEERRSPRTGPAYHVPVLREEVLDSLQPAQGKLFLDATLGGGGHSEALLERGAMVIGLDQDPAAIASASRRLAHFGDQFHAISGNFSDAEWLLAHLHVPKVDGILADLGVSSFQLDTADRGFSFMREGLLDMRMNPEAKVTAAELVNTMSGEQLERLFRTLGEEPAARRIAARIVRERAVRPLTTTAELASLVESVNPRRGKKTHPATRVFQALRMAVNHELESLEAGLKAFSRLLAPGGRLAIISFHSLEDRAVKHFFRDHTAEWLDRPEWPEPRPNPERLFRRVTTRALIASEEEQRTNPRSRSAKLRAVEKI
jgi:16S rRNA (cytosine1402-N4)-methyltransferase